MLIINGLEAMKYIKADVNQNAWIILSGLKSAVKLQCERLAESKDSSFSLSISTDSLRDIGYAHSSVKKSIDGKLQVNSPTKPSSSFGFIFNHNINAEFEL